MTSRTDQLWNEMVEGLALGSELEPLDREEAWGLYQRYALVPEPVGTAAGARGVVTAPPSLEASPDRDVHSRAPEERGAERDRDGFHETGATTRGLVAPAIAILAIASALTLLLTRTGSARFVLAAAHVVGIGFLLLLQRTAWIRPVSPPITRVGHEAWGQFLRGWTGLWMAWLFLYVWLTLAWSNAFQIGTTATWIAADLLNLCGGFAFFYLFLVLDKPSVPAQGQPERDRGFRRALALVSGICATAAVLCVLGRLGVYGWFAGMPRLDTILVAVSMMYFFARLNSHHMHIRRIMLAPLYLYVAIQIYWPGFADADASAAIALLGTALALKLYVFAVMTRWMRDGTLQRYFDVLAQPQTSSGF